MFESYIIENYPLVLETIRELCKIPAPSHNEEKRAEYCKEFFDKIKIGVAYIDKACNVVFPINIGDSNEITVIAAHTDTVFPDHEPMLFFEDEDKMYCPGVSDDTASVAVLLYLAKYFVENNINPEKGILFVCNSCEEGLGNLKGIRQLFCDYENRIKQFVTFDSNINTVFDRCVGSHRYEVTVTTDGGHSYDAFGKSNAIHELCNIVCRIYNVKVPVKENTKTTFNVGTIEGGTSVNTIAQSAKMLCEYRSDDAECLAVMKRAFDDIFENFKGNNTVKLEVKLVGDRPCGNADKEKMSRLKSVASRIIKDVTGKDTIFESASTDCNIPMSKGVPSLCIGVNNHGNIHTRQEWLDKESVKSGLETAIRFVLEIL